MEMQGVVIVKRLAAAVSKLMFPVHACDLCLCARRHIVNQLMASGLQPAAAPGATDAARTPARTSPAGCLSTSMASPADHASQLPQAEPAQVLPPSMDRSQSVTVAEQHQCLTVFFG